MCGAVRFTISARPLLTMACHCAGCQKLSASAYSLTIIVPGGGFALDKGAPVAGGLHREHRQNYCPDCKNWVFTDIAGMDIVNVRATMLDDHGWIAPFAEVNTAEGYGWARTGAELSYPGAPAMEDYPKAIEAFAARGPRPG